MSRPRIRIARVFSDYTGPLSGYLAEQMRLLDPLRFETQLVFLSQRCSPQASADSFAHHFLNGDIKLRGFRPSTAWRLSRIFRREKFDIVHCNRHSATVYGALARWLAGTGLVITHVHGMNRCRNWRRRLLYRVLSPYITLAIGCADAVRQDINDNFPGLAGKARTLVNSVDYERFHNTPEEREAVRDELGIGRDAFLFIFPARLVETKGHDLLIDSFASVLRLNPKARLLIVGEGRLRSTIEARARDLGILDKVLMPGFRSDVPRLLKASDVFVMSSLREGMPISILEAMASGLPVIATGGDGVREMLDNGTVGLFVDPRTVEQFAATMRSVIEMVPQRRADLIAAADRRVRARYHHAVVVRELENLYVDLLN